MEPAVVASFVVALVVFGVVSRRMERGVVSPPMVFVGLEFALGQLGWLDSGSELLYGLTERTLVFVLFTDRKAFDGSRDARRASRAAPATARAGRCPPVVARGPA